MDTETYNGSTNRETHMVGLHINNTQALQWEAHRLTRACINNGAGYPLTVGERVTSALKEMIYDELENGSVEGQHEVTLMLSDIGSFWRVDHAEIGQSLLDAVAEIDG
jgi:hypothetical protein